MKFVGHYKNTENGLNHCCEFEDIDDCLNYVMNDLFHDIGNGGMSAERNSDGSIGSLWRCADEIYDALKSGLHYSYADGEWWIEKLEESPKIHQYRFRFSAVLDNSVVVFGRNYEEAKKKSKEWVRDNIENLKATLKNGYSDWDYDGNVTDEGDEEIK